MTDNSTNTNGTPSPAKSSRLSTQSIILIVSVALNIFIIGVLIGIGPRLLTHGGPPPGAEHIVGNSPANTMHSFFRVMRAMPDEIRVKFRKQMKQTKGDVRPVWRSMRDNRGKVMDILTTSPLDQAALSDVFADQNALRQKAEQISQTALLSFLQSLTEEEKALFVEELKKAAEAGPSKGLAGGHRGDKWHSLRDRPERPFKEYRGRPTNQDETLDQEAPPLTAPDDVIPPAD